MRYHIPELWILPISHESNVNLSSEASPATNLAWELLAGFVLICLLLNFWSLKDSREEIQPTLSPS